MAKESGWFSKRIGWTTGEIFGAYVRYHASLKEGDATALWAERFRNYEEHMLGYDTPTFFKGAIDGAKDAVVKLGQKDPARVAETAMKSLDQLPLSKEAKQDFVTGFRDGFDQDALLRFIKASIKK